jgi:hypothetical protein
MALIFCPFNAALNNESLVFQLIETEAVEEKPRTTRKRPRHFPWSMTRGHYFLRGPNTLFSSGPVRVSY